MGLEGRMGSQGKARGQKMALTLVNLPGSWGWSYQVRNLILLGLESELLAPTN